MRLIDEKKIRVRRLHATVPLAYVLGNKTNNVNPEVGVLLMSSANRYSANSGLRKNLRISGQILLGKLAD